MEPAKSSVRTNPKPMHVFYVWYTELCRRMNCTPTPIVKPAKPKCQTVLDFIADRLKVEDWNPIVNALRHDTSLHVINIKSRVGNCQFLHDIDTEEKARHMKRRFGSIWTAYILRQLVKSISSSLRCTEVLNCLELDGLPMFAQYLEPLLQALKKNKTVKTLSFANCTINDIGCQLVCTYLRFTPNVEILNLSGCGLSAEGGEHLSKLIKYQQINRYCESWHNSLRYENPQSCAMRGIKRITINGNPDLGDDGLNYILNELEDDLWIKAIDLQKCGITENLSDKIIEVLQYNRSLEILDLRQNDLLEMTTIDRILQILRDRQQFGYQPEYQWCNTALTLTWNSLHDSSSKLSFATNTIHKTISAPAKNMSCNTSNFKVTPLRKSKTVENVQRRKPVKQTQDCDHKVIELSTKLKLEIQKRREMEKRNEELKQKLEKIKSAAKIKSEIENRRKTIVSSLRIEDKHNTSVEKCKADTVLSKPYEKKSHFSNNERNGYAKSKDPSYLKNGYGKSVMMKGNGVKPNGYKNGFSSNIINSACKIFESLLKKENYLEENIEEEDILKYFTKERTPSTETLIFGNEESLSVGYSGSQVSLFNFMEEIKKDIRQNTPNHKSTYISKYVIKENQKR